LKPGGYIEVSDILPIFGSDDNTIPPNYAVEHFYDLLRAPGPFQRKYRWNLDIPPKIQEELLDVGFVNLHQERRRLPIGRWARAVQQRIAGIYFADVLMEFAAAALVLHKDLGLDENEATLLLEEMRRCISDPSIHAYVAWTVVWAQKPATAQ
jgi:hypothetical protein